MTRPIDPTDRAFINRLHRLGSHISAERHAQHIFSLYMLERETGKTALEECTETPEQRHGRDIFAAAISGKVDGL